MSGNAEGSRRYERWFQGLRDRSALLLIGVTILGTLLVAVGWVVEGADYVPELLLQAGSALMMLVPLAFLGLVLEGRMRHTERRVEETVAQINALSVATREQLADHHRLRSDLFASAEANPTQQVIRVLLEDAAAINAIAQEGVRVRVQGTSLRARFRNAPDRSVQIRLERGDGSVLDTVSWPAQQPAEAFAAELRTALHTVQPSFPAQGFDPSELLTRLIRVIHLAVDARTGDSALDLGSVIEIPRGQWAVSTDGLYSLSRPYHIPIARISGAEDWRSHMRGLGWVDEGDFDEAYALARKLLTAPR